MRHKLCNCVVTTIRRNCKHLSSGNTKNRGANVNAINFDGWTPMDEAIASGQTATMDVLCTHEAVRGYFEHSMDLDHGIASNSKFKRDEMNNYA